MAEQLITVKDVLKQIPDLTRDEVLAAIHDGKIPCASTKAPWLVLLSDVVAWHTPPHMVKRADFIGRFTDAEKAAAVANPEVLTWWLQLMDMPVVDVSSDLVKANVAGLVTLGILTSDRAAVILAD